MTESSVLEKLIVSRLVSNMFGFAILICITSIWAQSKSLYISSSEEVSSQKFYPRRQDSWFLRDLIK